MERRHESEVDVTELDGARSGVFRAITPQRLAQLDRDLKDAASRVTAFRGQISDRHSVHDDDADLGWRALQEIDTAHEELRVVEEELHAQADEILSARETLSRERVVYGELFDGAPEAYLVTDARGIVTHANRRACTLFNLDRTFLLSKPLALLVAQQDRTQFRELVQAMGDALFCVEIRIQPRKADAAWVTLSAQRDTRLAGSPTIRWILCSATADKQEHARRDATVEALHAQVLKLEGSLRLVGHLLDREQAANKEANERLQEKERVLAEVAHELRSPLGTLAGWVHMMDKPLELGLHKRAVLSMTRGLRSLSRIVEELVEHARVQRHELTLDARPMNLLRVVIEVMEDLRPLAALKVIRVDLSAKSYNLEVHGDAFRLQQVVRNILGNAIKFTPERGLVRVEVGVVGSQAEIAIIDTGRGIEPASLTKVFKPFTQLGGPEKQKTGLGLGLSIAQRLVELHGGTITADSEGPQRGSTFRVRLPLLRPPTSKPPAKPTSKPPTDN